jgi:Peptidase inhibitor I9
VGNSCFSRGHRAAAVVAAIVAAGVPALAAPAQAAPPARTAVIVQLDAGAGAAAEARVAAANGGGHVRHVYGHVLRGFAGEFTDAAIAALRRNPHVVSVEPTAQSRSPGRRRRPPPPGASTASTSGTSRSTTRTRTTRTPARA